VEPPGVATLLVPTSEAGEELEPAASSVAFFVASTYASAALFATASSAAFFTAFASAALFAAASIVAFSVATACAVIPSATFYASTSSVAFFTAVTSVAFLFTVASLTAASSATFLVAMAAAAAVTSLTGVADLPPPDPPDSIIIATAFESGYGAVAFFGTCCPISGGLPIVDPSLQSSLFLLCRGTVSSDDASVSLGIDREPTLGADLDGAIFSFPLPEPAAVLAPIGLPVASVLGMCLLWDWSPPCRVVLRCQCHPVWASPSTTVTSWPGPCKLAYRVPDGW
jgi:hypothetical protein